MIEPCKWRGAALIPFALGLFHNGNPVIGRERVLLAIISMRPIVLIGAFVLAENFRPSWHLTLARFVQT